MQIAWSSLGTVFVVSFGSAVAVVLLVALALVALSHRAPRPAQPGGGHRLPLSPTAATALAALYLTAAAAIALYGLYLIAFG